ncbi:MAG: hypothetical protein HOV73_01795 [Streptomyces sp.]|nr:hypothetical protein [Streptomyces sp.]
MTSPTNDKTARVSPQNHAQLLRIAAGINGTVDDAIGFLLGESTVRVPLSDIQRGRWEIAAERAGVSLEQFVTMRVEAAIQYGGDPQGFQKLHDQIHALAMALGAFKPRSTGRTQP